MRTEQTIPNWQLLAQLVLVLTLLTSCVSAPRDARPRTAVPSARSSYARDAVDGTESLLQEILASGRRGTSVPVASLNEPCWTLLTTALAADPHYTLSVYDVFSTTTDPAVIRELRAVQNVYVQVDLADGKQVLIWWYAGGPASCA